MAGRSPSAPVSRRPLPNRILEYPAQLILSAIMSLAVTAVERRLRKARRPPAEPGDRASR
jgi:hypothetical protein